MKYMVISDIHGDIYKLNDTLDIYKKERCSKLLVLGDLFNYVFDIHKDEIINRLNSMKDEILAVRGNCDHNVNGLLFDMPNLAKINLNDKSIALTHGHLYDKTSLIDMGVDIAFLGHSHISSIEKIKDTIIVNPGSLSKSRRGDNSFAIVDENSITIRNLENIVIDEYRI